MGAAVAVAEAGVGVGLYAEVVWCWGYAAADLGAAGLDVSMWC